MTWRARALIDLSALENNISVARKMAGNALLYAVVKADAYGHGIANIIPTASRHVDGFAVATINEGMRCRQLVEQSGAELPIMVFSEFNSKDQLPLFAEHQLQPVIHSEHQIEWLSQTTRSLQYWIKVDTGMHRLGIEPQRLAHTLKQLADFPQLKVAGVMSHLASADNTGSTETDEQLERFTELISSNIHFTSIVNSAGLMNYPQAGRDLVRSGILLFGISADNSHRRRDIGLWPVMRLQSRIISVKAVRQGARVGYGGIWRCPADGLLGIVGFGYADGYPRLRTDIGYVLVNQQPAPLAGRVSMDMLTVYLPPGSKAAPGDVVELWGDNLPVENVASWANTIPYELMCRVSQRVERIPVNAINSCQPKSRWLKP